MRTIKIYKVTELSGQAFEKAYTDWLDEQGFDRRKKIHADLSAINFIRDCELMEAEFLPNGTMLNESIYS